MKILVTGASGFVGRYVIDELAAAGHALRLFSRRDPYAGEDKPAAKHPWIGGDLNDAAAVAKAVDGLQAIAHVGANPWMGPDTLETNIGGTWRVLEAAKAAGIRRVAIAGSDWGMGKSTDRDCFPAYVPVDAGHPSAPHDIYGFSKVVVEQAAALFARDHGMETAVFRITGVWKPAKTAGYAREDRKTAAADCARYWWSYVDVRDVGVAFRLALEAKMLPVAGVYALTAADTMIDEPTMDALARFMPAVTVRSPIAGHGTVFDLAAAKSAFGWAPARSWRAG